MAALAAEGLPYDGMTPLEELAVLIFSQEFLSLDDDQQVYVVAWCLEWAPVKRGYPKKPNYD